MDKGLFITVSGIDGSGKSTCIAWIYDYLIGLGIRDVSVVDCMKPGHYTALLKHISEEKGTGMRECFSPDMINLTWTSDLIYNRIKIIEPVLRRGGTVISHRSELCCRVYSHLFSEECDVIERMLLPMKCDDILEFYVDTTPDKAFERIQRRGYIIGDDSKEKMEYLIKAHELYGKFLMTEEYENVRIIGNNGDVEKMYTNVKIAVDEYIYKRN